MAFTTENNRTGDGTTTDFSFTFPYIEETDIRVTVEAAAAGSTPVAKTNPEHWSLANATTITFVNSEIPANNSKIRIFRDTDLDDPVVTYFAGSAIRAEDLNENQRQVLYSAQEVEDNAILLTGGTMTGNLQFNDANIVFEGENTTDGITTTLTVANPTTSSKTITLPNTTGTVVTTGDTNTVTGTMIADNTVGADNLSHTGVSAGQYTTADITVDEQGRITAASNGTITAPEIVDGSVTSNKIQDGTIVNVDINADAEIAVSKLADGAPRQLLQTAADGTTVAWTDDVDIPGTLDVTSTATFDANATVSGNLTVNGNTTLGNDASADTITTTARIAGDLVPSTDGNRNLGTSDLEWGNLHLDGTANIDSLNADTADINGGNIDNAVIGGTTPAAGTFTNLTANGSVTLGDAAADLITFTGEVNTNIVPSSNNAHDLGTSSKKWKDVHSEKFTGPLTGNVTGKADTADKLHSAVNIAGVSFDGSQNIGIPIENLSNVTITSLADNQILKWDASANDGNGQWVNEADGGSGSGSSTDLTHTRTDTAVTVISSTGSNVAIPAANATDGNSEGAGIMSKDQATRVARSILNSTPQLHGTLTTASNGDIVFAPNGTGSFGVTSGSVLQAGPAGGVTNPSFIVEGTNTDGASIWVDYNGDDAADSANIVLGRSNSVNGSGDHVFGIAAVTDNDSLGKITFAGADGTDTNTIGAQIESRVDGTPGTNDMPAELVFHTNSGAATTTPRMFIRSDGKVRIGPEIGNGNLAGSDATLQVLGDISVGQGNSIQFRANTHNNFVSLKCGGVSSTAGQAGYTLNLPGDRPTTANRFLKLTGTTDTDDQEHTLEWTAIDTSKAERIEHSNSVSGFTVANNSNAALVGPVTVTTGQTITVGNANSLLKIL